MKTIVKYVKRLNINLRKKKKELFLHYKTLKKTHQFDLMASLILNSCKSLKLEIKLLDMPVLSTKL